MSAHRHFTEHKSFRKADEVRQFPNGRAEILKVGGGEVGRLVFEPGWRWSNDVRPLAKTNSCEAPHFQYHVSGRLAILMDDGQEFIAEPGTLPHYRVGTTLGSSVTSRSSLLTRTEQATTPRPRKLCAGCWRHSGHETQ